MMKLPNWLRDDFVVKILLEWFWSAVMFVRKNPIGTACIAGGIVVCLLVLIYSYSHFWTAMNLFERSNRNITEFAQFGDSFGALTSFFTLFSTLFIGAALMLQAFEFRAFRQDLENQRSHRKNQASWETEPTFTIENIAYEIDQGRFSLVLKNVGIRVSKISAEIEGSKTFRASVSYPRNRIVDTLGILSIELEILDWNLVSIESKWTIQNYHETKLVNDKIVKTQPRSGSRKPLSFPEFDLVVSYQARDYEDRIQVLRVSSPSSCEFIKRDTLYSPKA